MEDTPVTEIMKVTFKNKEERDKFKRGEVHSNKGLRTKDGRSVTQPDIAFLDEEVESESRLQNQPAQREYHKSEFYGREQPTLKDIVIDACKDGIKEVIEKEIYELLYDEKKRKLFILRVNSLWKKNIAPRLKKVPEKAKFAKDVIYAVCTNEQPKVLRFLEESERKEITTAEAAAVAVDTFDSAYDEEESIILTEEELKKVKALMVLLADMSKKYSNARVLKGNMSEDQYKLEKEKRKEIFIKEVMEGVQMLSQKEGIFLDEFTVSILSGWLSGDNTIEVKHIPVTYS